MKRFWLSISVFPLALSACIGNGAVISELSRRSNVPVRELRSVLSYCEHPQRSMNLCAFRDAVEADLKLDEALRRVGGPARSSCRADLEGEQLAWRLETEQACSDEADEAAKGGSMRPMIYSQCLAGASGARLSRLAQRVACMPDRVRPESGNSP